MKHAYNIIFHERNSFDCKFSSLFFLGFLYFFIGNFMSDENLNMILRNVILSVFCHLSTVKEVTLTIRFGSLFYYYVFPEPCILFHIHMMVNTFGYLLYEQL